jgi:hypothetical protein
MKIIYCGYLLLIVFINGFQKSGLQMKNIFIFTSLEFNDIININKIKYNIMTKDTNEDG